MADRTIVVRLRAEVADLKSKMAEASKATEDFGKRTQTAIQKNSQHINTLSNQAGLLGAAMVAAAGVAVLAFANFDEAMSAVEAATHESAAAMGDLRDAALDAGQRTKFSATEAAGAIEELAKAGVSTADILGGALDGALDLAAAGNLDVAEAAGLAAVGLKQFKLGGDQATHVADLLAAGAGKAMGDVSDLGAALKQAGLVANSTGLSIEETTAGLAAFASAGLIGSDAGTSFKSMLQRLTPQSEEAQKKFDELGISAYDAQGNFVGLAKFSGNLQSAMKDLTPEARNSALAVMFGSDAVRAANVLYNEGESGIRDWTTAVDDAGYAAETAAIRMDNLKGDWEQLTGSVETALIGLGEGADGPLRALVQQMTDVVNAFAAAPDAVQGVLLSLVGGGGLVLLGVAGLSKLVVGISEAKVAMDALKISGKMATLAVAGAAGALAVGTIALSIWADANATAEARVSGLRDSLDEATGSVTRNTREVIANDLTARQGWWLFKQDSVADSAKVIGLSLDTVTDAILGNEDAISSVNDATSGLTVENGKLAKAADAAGVTISEYSTAMNIVKGEVDTLAGSLGDAKSEQDDVNEAVGAGTSAQESAREAFAETTVEVVDQTKALEDLVKAQAEASGIALSLRDAQSGFEASLDAATAAIEENGVTLDITTEAGRKNQSALDDIAQSGYDLVESMEANGATQEELQASLQGTRDNFIRVAQQMGLSQEAASALADQLGLIPSNITTQVTVDTGNAQAAINSFITSNTGKRIKVSVDTVGGTVYSVNGTGPQFNADGGYIAGPGTGTSDSILSFLSNGEYVIKADSVAKQPRAYWDNLNAGRFATGGFVGSTTGAPAGGGASLAGLAIEGTLDLGNGLVGMLRGVVRSELSTEAASVRARPRR